MQPANGFSIVKSQDLVQSMKRFQIEKTKESEKEFINNLISLTFLSPVLYESTKDINHNENESQNDKKINLLSLPNDNGEFFFPAFTEKDELLKWNAYPDKQVIFLKLKDYIDVLSTDNSKWSGVVINPFRDNFVLTTEQIKTICNPSYTIPKNESVIIGEPQEYPQKLVDALIDYLPSVQSVNRAYLLLMIRNKTEKSYLLVIDSNEDLKHIFDKVSSIASEYLVEKENIDFVSYSTKFGKDAVKDYKPFYEKLSSKK
ncbi:enhanced serine sensitivity protein SseB [Psychrobacillus vulpis]|nr:enhanced serine sensitivity protein SseB [Psychrobacillus vulpis]